jgi:hypothetical protein
MVSIVHLTQSMELVYQAIPPESSFYARLKHDRSFRIFSRYLFVSGSIFYSFKYDIQYFNDCIKSGIERHSDAFSEESLEVSLVVADFREAVRITWQDYPEIVQNTGMLEKSFDVVRDRLEEELSRRNFEDAAIIVDDLLYGDSSLGENEETFGLTTREAVKKGASILRQIEPETLFPGGDDGEEGWYWDDFRAWKEFYLDADDLGAEVLMQVL